MDRKKRYLPKKIPTSRYSFTNAPGFVHLHLHSEYSLLDGACRISEIPKKAKAMGHKAVAITDHGVMYGVVDFYRACKKERIKPIIGCEVYVAPRKMTDREHELDSAYSHLVLLVKNETGYKNLIYMVSKSFTQGFYSKPRIDIDLLRHHSDGLIALSACLGGTIPKLLVRGDYDGAKEHAELLGAIFGKGNFYLELQDHGIEEQALVNDGILRLHRETGLPMVATNDVHYLNKSDAEVQSVLMCIQTNSRLNDGKPLGFTQEEFYYKSTEEMQRLFGEYEGALSNSVRIAAKCDFDFEFGKTFLPRYKPENGQSPADYLRSLALDGFTERVAKKHIAFTEEHNEDLYRERIDYELSVIESMGYSEYYLIVWDFVHYSKSHGITVGPGRGSGAGSLVAYLIGIVDIDPIRYDLLFERFLNPERVSMPDFDIDFSYDKRDEAVEYVRRRYGEDHTSQIITFGTMAARAAIRDVGRVLGLTNETVDSVAALIPKDLDITLDKAMQNRDLQDKYNSDRDVRRLIDIAKRLEGMPRHASTHAAGVVITEKPLYEYVPLALNDNMAITQFPMETIADLGLLKFDFLALRYLTIIDACVRQIRESDPEFDVSLIDISDKETYAFISKGTTDGVFQLESGGMKQLLLQMKPDCIDDIIAAIALYRPGPMDSIPKYLENRADPSKIRYPTDKLAPILDPTHGCIVYQEQVMQIFRTVAGYSLGKADIVRRAIAKKKAHVLEAERDSFISGAAEHGVGEREATELFDDIAGFANYAFNKSHAAAYAVLSFRTAYLKCHYPREYLAALLTSVMDTPAKMADYIGEAKSKHIQVLGPSVNESKADFSVFDGKIRFGLDGIKNVSVNTVAHILSLREKDGPFRSIGDFLARIDRSIINRRQFEMLIKSGALDGLGPNRRQLFSIIEQLHLSSTGEVAPRELEGQVAMFGIDDKPLRAEEPEYEDCEEYSTRKLLSFEKETLGIFLSGHMINDYSSHVASLSHVSVVSLFAKNQRGGYWYTTNNKISVCGIITNRSDKRTKDGINMCFLTVEDETGECEVIVFPKNLAENDHLFRIDYALHISGRASVRPDDEPKIVLESVEELIPNDRWKGSNAEQVTAHEDSPAETEEKTEGVKQVSPSITPTTAVSQKPVGSRKMFIKMDMSDEKLKNRVINLISIFDEGTDYALFFDSSRNEYVRDLTLKCSATDFLCRELCSILGNDCVIVK